MSTLGYIIVLFFGIWLIRAEKSGCQETKRGNKEYGVLQKGQNCPLHTPLVKWHKSEAHTNLFFNFDWSVILAKL